MRTTTSGFICRACLAAALVSACAASHAFGQTNLITNGDFSANASGYTTFPGYDSGSNPAGPTGWTLTTTTGQFGVNGVGTVTTVFFNNAPAPFVSTSGRTVSDFLFAQGAGGVASQSVVTTSGHIYGVTFDAAPRNDGEAGDWTVQVGGTTDFDTGTFGPTGAPQWKGFGVSFVGGGGSTAISFTATNAQQDLANVNVADISGVWKGGVSGNLGGPDTNFADGTVNFATAASLSNTLYFNDLDGIGLTPQHTNLTTVAGGVSAGTLQFNNSAVNYTLTSADSTGVTGSTALVKLGTGTLTISGTNTYFGTTTVSGGTLEFVTETSLYNNQQPSSSNPFGIPWSEAQIIVNSGATLAFAVGGSGQFTVSDIQTLSGLGSGGGGFLNGSILGLETSNAAGGNFTYSSRHHQHQWRQQCSRPREAGREYVDSLRRQHVFRRDDDQRRHAQH